MTGFSKGAMISARVHESEKRKLQKSGYTARHAIEYFNKIISNEVEALNIEEYFLNKEIEDKKYDLITLERKLEDIQLRKDKIYKGHLSKLRIDSYQNIINEYNGAIGETTGKLSMPFKEFVEGKFIQRMIINELKPLNCPLDEYVEGLLDYYENVILVSDTI